ncbi:hypothetical protein ARMGADRAFT_1033540 [Armillaria gallica]|uniref:Uncharacterized protein n=1 Tax=Armillaria gallica TaxID=47427 RepID=A0A2H3DDI6_ARMGA|nr:hypothetical protein ARMGADRAFT_1033540 [Armillaria gallica]
MAPGATVMDHIYWSIWNWRLLLTLLDGPPDDGDNNNNDNNRDNKPCHDPFTPRRDIRDGSTALSAQLVEAKAVASCLPIRHPNWVALIEMKSFIHESALQDARRAFRKAQWDSTDESIQGWQDTIQQLMDEMDIAPHDYTIRDKFLGGLPKAIQSQVFMDKLLVEYNTLEETVTRTLNPGHIVSNPDFPENDAILESVGAEEHPGTSGSESVSDSHSQDDDIGFKNVEFEIYNAESDNNDHSMDEHMNYISDMADTNNNREDGCAEVYPGSDDEIVYGNPSTEAVESMEIVLLFEFSGIFPDIVYKLNMEVRMSPNRIERPSPATMNAMTEEAGVAVSQQGWVKL